MTCYLDNMSKAWTRLEDMSTFLNFMDTSLNQVFGVDTNYIKNGMFLTQATRPFSPFLRFPGSPFQPLSAPKPLDTSTR